MKIFFIFDSIVLVEPPHTMTDGIFLHRRPENSIFSPLFSAFWRTDHLQHPAENNDLWDLPVWDLCYRAWLCCALITEWHGWLCAVIFSVNPDRDAHLVPNSQNSHIHACSSLSWASVPWWQQAFILLCDESSSVHSALQICQSA